MTRKRLLGVLGLAATLSVPGTITAHAATSTGVSPPQSPDTAGATSRPHAVPMAAYYGARKFHFGVKLADGSYDTAAPPDLTGAAFEIDETGPTVGVGGKATSCTMDLGSDPGDSDPFPGETGYHYFCNFHQDPAGHPGDYYTYFVGDGDRFTVHQVSAPAGVQFDPAPREPTSCAWPGDTTGGTCDFYGWYVDFVDYGQKPIAANFGKVVNHGKAQTIDVLAKSRTGGATPTITIAKKPAHGSAVVRSNKIVYTPASTYGGADTFSYALTTAHGSSAGTVHMAIQVPPVARADSAHTKGKATKHGTPVTVAVLANDLARGSALKGLAVSVKPKHGTAAVSGTKIKYTPAKGFHGTDVVTYLVKNAYGSAKAKLTITVSKPPKS